MKVYTYSEARQNLASLLEEAVRKGDVRIKRRDGQIFSVKPQLVEESPLDVEGIDLEITADEIVGFIREGRRASYAEMAELLDERDDLFNPHAAVPSLPVASRTASVGGNSSILVYVSFVMRRSAWLGSESPDG